jgi:signal transduction histidine kinase
VLGEEPRERALAGAESSDSTSSGNPRPNPNQRKVDKAPTSWSAHRPPAGFLAITALISAAAGYAAYRVGLLTRAPRLSWTLLAGYVLAGLLTLLNVMFAARLMFASPHDLALAAILLIFAGGIAMSVGHFAAAAVTDRIAAISRGAEAVAAGNLDARVPAVGNDEVAALARAFNTMAAQLQAAQQQQQELAAMRRDLIAWAGHDLRTPLASVRAIVEALADGVVEDPDTVQRYLRTAQRDILAIWAGSTAGAGTCFAFVLPDRGSPDTEASRSR